MARRVRAKTSFTAGELTPELHKRHDVRAHAHGAAHLENVLLLATGGVRRRPGLRHVARLPRGAARLAPFSFNREQAYVVAFSSGALSVYRSTDGANVATLASPWNYTQLPQLSWFQAADTMFLTHPDVAPRLLVRSASGWTLSPWPLTVSASQLRTARSWGFPPFYDFIGQSPGFGANSPSRTSWLMGVRGLLSHLRSVPAYTGCRWLECNGFGLGVEYEGVRLRINQKQYVIVALYTDSQGRQRLTSSFGEARQAVVRPEPGAGSQGWTHNWQEQVFSPRRGWPVCCVVHKGRLVIGGTRDLPSKLWFSKVGDFWNFDFGQGLDDEAIELDLLSDEVNAVRGFGAGESLQVFTAGGEWCVKGAPLTPETATAAPHSRVGSLSGRCVRPHSLGVSALFAAGDERRICEFAPSDYEGLHQTRDVAVLAGHMVREPVDMAFDGSSRVLYVALANGHMAALTFNPEENVVGWSRLTTNGAFLSVACVDTDTYAAVERDGETFLEQFDDTAHVDNFLRFIKRTGGRNVIFPEGYIESNLLRGGARYMGLGNLKLEVNGEEIKGATRHDWRLYPTSNRRSFYLAFPRIWFSQPLELLLFRGFYTHEIRPLPVESSLGAHRLVRAVFTLHKTPLLRLDTGSGLQPWPVAALGTTRLGAPLAPYSGDIVARGEGWRRGTEDIPWRIRQGDNKPFTLLAVTTEHMEVR